MSRVLDKHWYTTAPIIVVGIYLTGFTLTIFNDTILSIVEALFVCVSIDVQTGTAPAHHVGDMYMVVLQAVEVPPHQIICPRKLRPWASKSLKALGRRYRRSGMARSRPSSRRPGSAI